MIYHAGLPGSPSGAGMRPIESCQQNVDHLISRPACQELGVEGEGASRLGVACIA
jgi:hypothetical protein